MKILAVIIFLIPSFVLLNAQPKPRNFEGYLLSVEGTAVADSMVPIHPGNFLMGSPAGEQNRETDEGPQKGVTLGPFWMGAHEVTRDAFDAFYTDAGIPANSDVDAITRPSPQYIDFSLGMGKVGGYPVNSLSQYAALMYCRWLSSKTGHFYRLPTEAEWEYACRAGSVTRYFFGDDESALDAYAWYQKNSDNRFHKTGLKLPNAWGLFDMLGNVTEWTLDHYYERRMDSLSNNVVDPVVSPRESRYPKALRGGSYADDAANLRTANRHLSNPEWNRRDPQIPKSKWWLTDAPWVGFRIVRPVVQPSQDEVNAFFDSYLGY